MKAYSFIGILILCTIISKAQEKDSISKAEVGRLIRFLASDRLKGRGNFTPQLQEAAQFISKEFSKDSLQYFPGYDSYFQPFALQPLTEKDRIPDSTGLYPVKKVLLNVVAVIEGRSKKEEAIIFSAH